MPAAATKAAAIDPAILTAGNVLAARQHMAKTSLKWFAQHIDIPGAPVSEADDEDKFTTFRCEAMPRHHEVIFENLQKLADDELTFEGEAVRDVIVIAPPGSAKSTCVDVIFIPWFMARRRRQNVILASYGSDLVKRQGRKARQLVRSRDFQTLFPGCAISDESSAADEWKMEGSESELFGGGILSGITGGRADLLVIDDPVKNRTDADSETIRNKTWSEYVDTLRSRFKPGMRTIIITTRWHEDDIPGRTLPADWNGESGFIRCRDGRVWLVLRFAAKCDSDDDPAGRKRGEWLWEGYLGKKMYGQFESLLRTFMSLYQGKPTPPDGTYYDTGLVERIAPPPRKKLNIVAASDYATKSAEEEGDADFTVHMIGGVDKHGNLHVLDVWRRQTKSDTWTEQQIAMARNWKPLEWAEPDDLIRKANAPHLEREMKQKDVHFYRVPYSTSKNKPTNGLAAQALNQKRRICVSPDAPWANELLAEMQKFPAVKNDDQCDALALLAKAAANVGPFEDEDDESFERGSRGDDGQRGGGGWQSRM